jgi:hypothetical protein
MGVGDVDLMTAYPELAAPPGGTAIVRATGTAGASRCWRPAAKLVAPAPRRQYRTDGAGTVSPVRWRSTDGTQVSGLLVSPPGDGAHPVVMYVHGGPVWAWRSRWSMGYAQRSHGRGSPSSTRTRGSIWGGDVPLRGTWRPRGGVDDLPTGPRPPRRRVSSTVHVSVCWRRPWAATSRPVGLVTDGSRAVSYRPVTEWVHAFYPPCAQDHLLMGRPGRGRIGRPGAHTDARTTAADLIRRAKACAPPRWPRVLTVRQYPLEVTGTGLPARLRASVLGWFEHHSAGLRTGS